MSDRWASPSGDDPQQQPPTGGPPPAYGQQAPPYGQQAPAYGQRMPPPPLGVDGVGGPGYGQQGQYGGPGYDGPAGGYYGPGYPGMPSAPGPAWNYAKPGVIPLRPLSLGDIYSGAMATIRGNPGATIGLSMILAIIVAVPTTGLTLTLRHTATTDPRAADALTAAIRGITQLISAFSSIILSGMLIAVLSEAVLGRRMTIGEAWKRTRRHIGSLIVLPIILGVAAAAAVIAVVLIIWALAVNTPPAASISLGVLLSIAVLCVIVFCYIRLVLAAPTIVLERCGPLHAIRRSWQLSAGQFWRLFGINVLTSFIVGAATGIVSAVVVIPVTLASAGDPGTVLPVSTALGVLLGGVTAPFAAHVTGLLYVDERIRKEGLDVSLAAAATPQKNAAF